MSQTKETPLMEKIVSLCKRKGFIFQSSEIYGGINGFWHHVFALAHHRAPPRIAQIAFQLRAEWAVVPEAVDASVDFGRLEDEALALAEAQIGRAHV